MSLINCPECKHEISEFAATCSSCGLQVASAKEARPVGSAIMTVQETSKRLRLHTLGAIAAILFGMVWLIIQANSGQEGGATSPVHGLLIFAGLAWYIISRVRIWWHHSKWPFS